MATTPEVGQSIWNLYPSIVRIPGPTIPPELQAVRTVTTWPAPAGLRPPRRHSRRCTLTRWR
eukprot:7969002-Pyramimonas_sp.AAC.1